MRLTHRGKPRFGMDSCHAAVRGKPRLLLTHHCEVRAKRFLQRLASMQLQQCMAHRLRNLPCNLWAHMQGYRIISLVAQLQLRFKREVVLISSSPMKLCQWVLFLMKSSLLYRSLALTKQPWVSCHGEEAETMRERASIAHCLPSMP